ncbi:SMP-30/gluconolactonase/LRE family protein [Bacillus manliponensis]|uniref:SMP-30/gluconolactonase/LRE family protein n=1 Tax=Bacillus manliponensis TaxID=574376 RepID=UPI003512F999
MLYKAELVIDARATLGEGPCWDAENRLLYWGDILEKKVHIYNPITKENQEMFVGENLNELYVTTARTRMTEKDLEVYPYAGGVFKIKTNVRGCVTHPFNN